MNEEQSLFADLMGPESGIPIDRTPLGGVCRDHIIERQRTRAGGFALTSMRPYGIANLHEHPKWLRKLTQPQSWTDIEKEIKRGLAFQYIVSHRDEEGVLRTGSRDRLRQHFLDLLEDYGYHRDHELLDDGCQLIEAFKKVRR